MVATQTTSQQARRDDAPITTAIIYWIAGFLEGEGSFLWFAPDGKRGGRLRISAPQVQDEPILRLMKYVGGRFALYDYSATSQFNIQPIHKWEVSGVLAASWMMTLYPLMSPWRQTQIKVALDGWKNHIQRLTSTSSSSHCLHGHLWSENAYMLKMPSRPNATRFCRACNVARCRDWRTKEQIRKQPVASVFQ